MLAVPTAQAKDDITVTVDGDELSGMAFVQEDVTYVQLSALLEAVGGWEAVWNGESNAVMAETGLFTLTVPCQCLPKTRLSASSC